MVNHKKAYNVELFDPKPILKKLGDYPGVYRMLDADGKVLYVGKAGSLKKRVSSYFNSGRNHSGRILQMLNQVRDIQVTVVRTDAEALLLESQLIKAQKPRYNILLRDDKSYPYIRFSPHKYPRLSRFRGSKSVGGEFFGPYPSVSAVRQALDVMQKLFQLRTCEDTVFSHRKRPCLQYQIKRCAAPCTGLITEDDYAKDLNLARQFLEGKTDDVIEQYATRMEQSSQQLAFEEAARYRDIVARLRTVQQKSHVDGVDSDADAIACYKQGKRCCIYVQYVRGGQNIGGRAFFPAVSQSRHENEILSAFISQYYSKQPAPKEILTNGDVSESLFLEQALSERAQRKVHIKTHTRGGRAGLVQLAQRNASHSLNMKIIESTSAERRVNALLVVLDIDQIDQIECFDISHTQGEVPVASCVVFRNGKMDHSLYRRFNIKGITPGDDYAALNQAVKRRYSRLIKEHASLPDVLMIDGGKGQMSHVLPVIEELGLELPVLGVSKGPERRAGEEQLHYNGRCFELADDDIALHLIQEIRDEAHRFAITGHRARRAKKRQQSTLQGIPGVGATRRAAILRHFGGLQGVLAAGIEELEAVNGLSKALAERIYHTLHVDAEAMKHNNQK
ncbi:MAG: excinuclease ABC subunit UvrC [bacterium]